MKEDLHMWMNRKSMDKPMVRIRAYAKSELVCPISQTSPDSGSSVHRIIVSKTPVVMDGLAVDEAVSGTSIGGTSFSDKPTSDAVSHGWPTRWRQSPLISGLMIVSGAVMVGLLMGWTVLTLLAPIPAG